MSDVFAVGCFEGINLRSYFVYKYTPKAEKPNFLLSRLGKKEYLAKIDISQPEGEVQSILLGEKEGKKSYETEEVRHIINSSSFIAQGSKPGESLAREDAITYVSVILANTEYYLNRERCIVRFPSYESDGDAKSASEKAQETINKYYMIGENVNKKLVIPYGVSQKNVGGAYSRFSN